MKLANFFRSAFTKYPLRRIGVYNGKPPKTKFWKIVDLICIKVFLQWPKIGRFRSWTIFGQYKRLSTIFQLQKEKYSWTSCQRGRGRKQSGSVRVNIPVAMFNFGIAESCGAQWLGLLVLYLLFDLIRSYGLSDHKAVLVCTLDGTRGRVYTSSTPGKIDFHLFIYHCWMANTC